MFMPSFFVISMSYFSASSVGARVQAVRPAALVERADTGRAALLLSISRLTPVGVFPDLDLAHAEVAVDRVDVRLSPSISSISKP